ncbi:DNA polymerase IV [Tissierella sp. Yu-01]|uniref:DNA polymerase IV n=1 Tax=Tissierella sp. Yu-01 TaxID=3035694 RepID=UPI00240DFF76|nr:DNA polymerase IV [Tissierella sp. Yu-01]WFA08928.1 DNA polymerase IV [Tissierella sp. Yu-01]
MENLSIIHIDMDAFYASVEEHDNPKLKGHPVIVGGKSRHGIVTTANYEARRYGIHSAMPIFMARELCPSGIFIQPRMERYREVSNIVMDILYDVTDVIEQLSIDEAYLDISDIKQDPLYIAKTIKSEVFKQTGLTLSVGISYNKFLAKLASDWNKPNGIKIITSDMVPEILFPLPVKSVYGIGKKSAKKLNDIGIFTVDDLIRLSEEFLIELFGKSGGEIFDRIRGIDHRKVDTSRERKSIGSETTFNGVTNDMEILKSYLREFAYEIAQAMKDKGVQGRTITVKIKDENFVQHTKSKTINSYISSADEIYIIAGNLLSEINLEKNLRLIGLTISNLISLDLEQLSLFD